jgi:ethanolamine utilization protein EutM
MKEALGIIETIGLTAAIEAADTAVKAANVTLLGYELTRGGGKIAVKITGEVGAVKAAVTAGVMAANRVNEVYAYHIIPRPHGEIDSLITNVDRGRGRGNGAPEGVIPPPPAPDLPAVEAEEPPPPEPEPAPEPEPIAAVAEEEPEPPAADEELATAQIAVPAVGPELLPAEEPALPEPEIDEPAPAAAQAPAGRCAATTLAGTRCRNRAVAGSAFCQVHQPKEAAADTGEEA